jgi:protein-tyrosine phosphatase
MRLTEAIQLPDGAWVRGRGLRHPLPSGPEPEFGLYLGSPKLRQRHETSLRWPTTWLDWPDFRLPRDPETARAAIRNLHARALAGERVEVACGGGVGRTGTVLACLAILAGHPREEAVAWARENHNRHAVETPWQRRWARNFPT